MRRKRFFEPPHMEFLVGWHNAPHVIERISRICIHEYVDLVAKCFTYRRDTFNVTLRCIAYPQLHRRVPTLHMAGCFFSERFGSLPTKRDSPGVGLDGPHSATEKSVQGPMGTTTMPSFW